ncbi:MAG: mechanosensitive ion channel family protein [Halanaeroarchaeum sp.]
MNVSSWWGDASPFRGVETIDERVAASAIVLAIAVVLSRYVVPILLTRGRRVVSAVVVRGSIADRVDTITSLAPWWATLSFFVSVLRAGLAIVTAVVVLLLWGQYDLVRSGVAALELSVPYLAQVGVTIGVVIVAWIVLGFVDSWLDVVTERSDTFTKHQEEITYRVLQIVTLTAVFLAALTMWGIDLGGLLVGAGFLGIVVGIAAQQTLGSLLAGFVLMFSRPFEIGDWVKIGQEEGIVTDITIVNTRMENFDGEFVVLPNDTVSNSTIINRTRKGRIRLAVEVGVDYDADLDHAMETAEEALEDVEEILSVPRPMVVYDRLGDFAIVLQVRFWIDKPSSRRRARATSAVVTAIKRAYDREGIKIPFPQRELAGREETGGFRVVDEGTPDEGPNRD